MRNKIGIVLMLLSIPYAIWGATHGNDPSVYLGVVALIVVGGLVAARGRNNAQTARRPDLTAVPKPMDQPASDDATRPPTAPASGAAPSGSEVTRDRQATILPPPPNSPASGKTRLRLVHTDGIRMTPEQLRYKAK